MEYGASFRGGKQEEQMAEIAANPEKQAALVEAYQAWGTEMIGNEDVCEYLADETWEGVLIGWLMGRGFTLDEAAAIFLCGGFPV